MNDLQPDAGEAYLPQQIRNYSEWNRYGNTGAKRSEKRIPQSAPAINGVRILIRSDADRGIGFAEGEEKAFS